MHKRVCHDMPSSSCRFWCSAVFYYTTPAGQNKESHASDFGDRMRLHIGTFGHGIVLLAQANWFASGKGAFPPDPSPKGRRDAVPCPSERGGQRPGEVASAQAFDFLARRKI